MESHHLFQVVGPLVANCERKSWPLRKKPGSDRSEQLTASSRQGRRGGGEWANNFVTRADGRDGGGGSVCVGERWGLG